MGQSVGVLVSGCVDEAIEVECEGFVDFAGGSDQHVASILTCTAPAGHGVGSALTVDVVVAGFGPIGGPFPCARTPVMMASDAPSALVGGDLEERWQSGRMRRIANPVSRN